jgi:hypothetical protein
MVPMAVLESREYRMRPKMVNSSRVAIFFSNIRNLVFRNQFGSLDLSETKTVLSINLGGKEGGVGEKGNTCRPSSCGGLSLVPP